MSGDLEAEIQQYDRQKTPHVVFNLQYKDNLPEEDVLGLLPPEEIMHIRNALHDANALSFSDYLYPGVDRRKVDRIATGRISAFIDNYAKTRLFQLGGCPPEVAVGGLSGIYNAAVATGAVTLVDVLYLLNTEARAIVSAQEAYYGGMFRALIKNVAGEQIRGIITEEIQDPLFQDFYIRRSERAGEVFVGAHSGYSAGVLEELQQSNPKIKFLKLENPDAPVNSPLIQPDLEDFQKALAEVTIEAPKIWLLGENGNTIMKPEEIRDEFMRQVITRSNRKAIEGVLRRQWRIYKPHNIGRDSTEEIDTSKLGIAAAAFQRKEVQFGLAGLALGGVALTFFWRRSRQAK